MKSRRKANAAAFQEHPEETGQDGFLPDIDAVAVDHEEVDHQSRERQAPAGFLKPRERRFLGFEGRLGEGWHLPRRLPPNSPGECPPHSASAVGQRPPWSPTL